MRPTSVIFNTTDRCSLRCKYCFAHPNPRDTTLKVAKDAVRYLADNWLATPEKERLEPSFAFFGGEPTLMWDEVIIPVVTWCRETIDKEIGQSVAFSITTNGQHLTRERIELWKNFENTGFLLSIDGVPDVQDYDRPREDGGKSSTKLIEIIPDLLEFFPYTTFRSTVTPYSVNYLFDSYIWAYEWGFKNYFVIPNMREEWPEEARKTLDEHMEQILNIHYIDITLKGYPGLHFNPWFNEFDNILKKDVKVPITTKRCGLGTTSCGIGINGEIFGCQEHNTYDKDDIFYLGNIYTGGIEQERIDALLEKYSSLEIPRSILGEQYCETCPLKNRCSLLFCPSVCLETTGQLNLLCEMDCIWKQIKFKHAERILNLIEEDNNFAALDYLQNNGYLPKEEEGCSCHTPQPA